MTGVDGSWRVVANRGLRGVGSGEEDGESRADINSLGKVGGCLEGQSWNRRRSLLGVGPN